MTMLLQAPATIVLLILVLTLAVAGTVRADDEDPLRDPSSLSEQAPDVFKARFQTTRGDFVVEVHREWAPLGADRFYNLVKNGFFDDTGFFRVVPNFVVQFGLSGSAEVNGVWRQARIKDDPVKQSNLEGYVTFATAGPNTRTTQVFISLRDNTRLDGMGFAPFGKVVEGMDVVRQITARYGEQPRQDLITQQGNAYLKGEFPELDFTTRATIVE